MESLTRLDALGANGPYRSRNVVTVHDVAGAPVAELSLLPPLFVTRAISALAKAEPLPAQRRAAALAAAGEAFAEGVVAGQSAEDYQRTVSRVSGLPISVVRSALRHMRRAAVEATDWLHCARPGAAVDDWRDPATRGGAAVWTRRGEVFAVLAAGNHPAAHGPWLEALALGYRVAVRPSRREPFTPYRLVSALREAGFGPEQVVLLPTDHAAADALIEAADLSMVYGGDDVIRKYAHDPTVLPQGPGRTKMVLTGGDDWRAHLDTVVESVSGEGGTACVNASAVFVEGDAAPVAEAVAERLAAIPSRPPEDEEAVLPVLPEQEARRFDDYLRKQAQGCTAWLGGQGVVDELGDGSAVLRPAVMEVDRAEAPQTAIELGFPCVWVAPWSRDDGLAALRNTLVLTVSTEDDELVERLLREPSIAGVYVGDEATLRLEPGLPQDGYLSEFLMRTKAVIRPGSGEGSDPAPDP